MRRFAELVLGLLGAIGAAGCGAERPFILTRGSDLRDLYARGELTDAKGNLWNVRVLPGVVPPLERGGEAFADSGRWMTRFAEGDYYADLGDDFHDGIELAFETGIAETIGEGIPEGIGRTNARVAELVREGPFLWAPRVAGRALWGYAIEPVGRTVAGAGIWVLGMGYGIAGPPLQVAGRPVVAAGNAAIFGMATPAALIAVHQPIYAATILNREPSIERDENGLLVELLEPAKAN